MSGARAREGRGLEMALAWCERSKRGQPIFVGDAADLQGASGRLGGGSAHKPWNAAYGLDERVEPVGALSPGWAKTPTTR